VIFQKGNKLISDTGVYPVVRGLHDYIQSLIFFFIFNFYFVRFSLIKSIYDPGHCLVVHSV